MKKLLAILALLLAPSLAEAQCGGVFAANRVCGSVAGGPPTAVPFPSFTLGIGAPITGGTNTYILYNNAGTLGNEQFVPLANGGLGASQAAAPASSVPVFPGAGGAAAPTLLSTIFAAPPAIGGTTPAAGTFTTLTVSSCTGCSLTIIANSTATTGFTAGKYLYSDGSKVQAGTFGTGVQTALGLNVGSAGAPVLFNGALGTPTSGTGTNLTGTAAGLTAGNVTTNANLTGVITSVGNATSIASQTGTGTKFVVDTSPTLVTPTLGVATGTSLALGGGSIGSDALEVTGTTTHNGATVIAGASFGLSGNISAPAWTTNGVRYKNVAATLTDTSSSGTVATAYTDVWGGNTIAASSAATYTNYFGSYFKVPVAGTNVGLTSAWAVGADSLKVGTSNPLTVSTAGVLNATSPVFVTPALGTPVSGVLTNATGLPVAGLSNLGANVGAFLVTPSSANFTSAITGPVAIAAGGTAQATALAARSSSGLNIDSCTLTGNANYTILTTDRCVYHTSLSAPRTDTLPAANAVNAGQLIVIQDQRGVASASNTVSVQRAGSDTVNGGTTFVAVNVAYGVGMCWSDGTSTWNCSQVAGGGGGGSGTVTSVAVSGCVTASSSPITVSGTLGTNCTFPPQGRLSLTTGVPVMTSTVSGATTVYYVAYGGGRLVPVYDGTNMAPQAICAANTIGACQLTITLGTAWAATSNFDVFVGVDSGTVRGCTGPVWTSSTARGTGAGTTQLTTINGISVNAFSLTCQYNNTTTFTCAQYQCTYVGTFRTTGSTGTTEFVYGASAVGGTAGSHLVWNAYNRLLVRGNVFNSSTSWVYTTATYQAVNGSSTMRVSFIYGLTEDIAQADYTSFSTNASPAAGSGAVGYDSTTTLCGIAPPIGMTNSSVAVSGTASCIQTPLGLHFMQALEQGGGSGTTTWYGATGNFVAGMSYNLRM